MNTYRLTGLSVALMTALDWSVTPSMAAPVTISFSGYITFIDDYLQLDDSVQLGTAFHGGYSFDPTGVTDFYANDPQVGLYRFGSSGRMWAQIGNYEFVTHDLGIFVTNNLLSGDVYEPISGTPFVAAGYKWSGMAVLLGDDFGTALDSDALPTGVPELLDFPTYSDLLIHLPGNDLGIGGELTSLTPEPHSITLLSLGAGVLVACRRRR